MDIYIPALASHIPIVRANILKLKTFCPKSPITIVTPDVCDYQREIGCLFDDVGIKNDLMYLPIAKEKIAMCLPGHLRYKSSWYYQQFLKYDIILKSQSPVCLIVDADTILLSSPEQYANINLYSSEYNKSYFHLFEFAMRCSAPLPRSSIVNFMIFNKHVLSGMISHVETIHSISFFDFIMSALAQSADYEFSEYEMYANWYALTIGFQDCKKLRLFRRADLLTSPNRIDSILPILMAKNYEAVACERNHARSFHKFLLAKFILLLGIDYW